VKTPIKCISCNSDKVIKKGIRRKKLQSAQRYCCKDCRIIFTLEQAKGRTYPLNIILTAISTYNVGRNLKQTSERISNKYKIKIPLSTISNWLNEYKGICTFSRLRKEALKQCNCTPKDIIHNPHMAQRIQPNLHLQQIKKTIIKTLQPSKYLIPANPQPHPALHIQISQSQTRLPNKRKSKIQRIKGLHQ